MRQDILTHIVQGFDAESGSIALIVDGTEDELEIAAGTDLPQGVVGSRLQRGVGVFGHVVATGQPILINGNAAEAGLPLRVSEPRNRPAHSAMCWPLVVQEQIIGALAVNRATSRQRYTVEDLDRGQALASLLALVIANHRMNVERDNRIVELSTLERYLAARQRDARGSAGPADPVGKARVDRPDRGRRCARDQQSGGLRLVESRHAGIVPAARFLRCSTPTSKRTMPRPSLPPTEALVRARMLRNSHDFDFLRGDIVDLLASRAMAWCASRASCRI